MASGPRVLVLQAAVAPYRLPLFERMNDEFDTEVWFCRESSESRRWDPEPDEFEFDWRILDNLVVGLLVVNYTVLFDLRRGDHDVYVVGESPRSLVATLSILLYAAVTDRPVIVWTGGIDTEYRRRKRQSGVLRIVRPVYGIYRRFLYASADAFVAYSDQTVEFLSNRGVDVDNVFVGGQVTPEETLSEPTETGEEDGDPLRLLFLGYLYERKGVGDLIEAFDRAALDDAELVIAGDGPMRDALEAIAGSRGDIRFVGYVEGEEKANIIDRSDIFVQPTHHDPSSHVLNEAMYYGLPIITTRADGGSEKIDGNGIVVDPGDVDALARAIEALATDDDRRAAFATRSEELGRRYTSVEHGCKAFVAAVRSAFGEKSDRKNQ